MDGQCCYNIFILLCTIVRHFIAILFSFNITEKAQKYYNSKLINYKTAIIVNYIHIYSLIIAYLFMKIHMES